MIGIYIIKCLKNNKVYIGQSVNVRHRLYLHKCDLKHNRHSNPHLQSAYNKYGEEAFSYEILEELPKEHFTPEKLDELEINYIKLYNSANRVNGFNIETGGSPNKVISEETRKKLSLANQGKYKGRKVSEKTRELMSKNSARYWLGKKMSDEARANMSKAKRGIPNGLKGYKQTFEHIRKRTDSQFGKMWVHKDNESRFVTKDDAKILLSLGYVLGRPFKKRNRVKNTK